MPSTSDGGGAALDAQVETADSQPDIDQVARAEAEAAQADDTVERLTTKVEKAKAQYDDAKQALADAKAEAKARHADLKDARKDGGD